MGLFSKKTCSICGASIGILGNKKLADGDMCKECSSKLSPWFDNRRESTVEDIKNQLKMREENRKQLDSFKTDYAYGEFSCILIDESNKRFVALPTTSDTLFGNSKVITSIDEIKDKNPDIIEFSQIKDIKIEAKVNENEIKKTENGMQVSYNPKHFEYMCNFKMKINVEHPYINEINLNLNDSALAIPCTEQRRVTTYAEEIRAALTGVKHRDFDIENNANYREVNSLKDLVFNSLKVVPDYSFGFKVDQHKNWRQIQEYHSYILMCEQIKNILEKK